MLYNGYTYDEKDLSARRERIFSDYKTHFQLTHTTEQTADDLAALVDVVNASEPLGSMDVQQASDWQDTPEYKEAHKASDSFNIDTVQEVEF